MSRIRRLRRALCVLLVFGLAIVPFMPATASVAKMPAAAAAPMHHVDDSKMATAGSSLADDGGHVQHDQCDGGHCGACSHCTATILPLISGDAADTKAVQFPNVPAVSLAAPATGPIRPPQIIRS